ncbi:MAG: hypothetical protein U9P14_05540, partial [Gemmatimonadota bacterium]|nr:hypothetical protein [Gemmatimonadota bacterium]
FSEKVSKQAAEKLISLSPPAGRLFFKWKGSRVRIGPERGLREDITYRLMVGPGLTDFHRVKSDSTFTSFFATGSHFSPGRIGGTVSCRDTLVEGALLFAASLADTSLVFDCRTDSAGYYRFSYLPYGRFRLLAFRDRNRNSRFDFTREEGTDSVAGLVFEPLEINFQLVMGDTTAPFIGSVSTPDSVTVELVFDDMLDSLRGILDAEIVLRTPDSLGELITIDSVRTDSTDRRSVLLHLARPLVDGNSYHVRARRVVNAVGLTIRPGRDSRAFRYEQASGEPGRGRRK